MRPTFALLAAAALGALAALPAAAGTLDQIKARGQLICGSNPGLAGFALADDQGVYKGLDVDECRAIAAAIFNDPMKVKFIPLNAKDRPTVLASGEIDVLIRNTTWTLSRRPSASTGRARASVYWPVALGTGGYERVSPGLTIAGTPGSSAT